MEILKAYIQKEMREQKLYLLSLVLMLPVTFCLVGFCIRSPLSSRSDFLASYAWTSLILAVSVFGCDLFGGEMRRGGVRLLSRLPAGLHPSFFTKTITFFLLTTISWIACMLIGLAVHAQCLWFSQFLKYKVYQSLSRFYQYNGEFLKEIISDWPLHLSFYLSSCFVLITISCWSRKLGLGLLIWIGYVGSVFYLYHAFSAPLLIKPEYLSVVVVNQIFTTIYPILTFLLAYLAFTRKRFVE